MPPAPCTIGSKIIAVAVAQYGANLTKGWFVSPLNNCCLTPYEYAVETKRSEITQFFDNLLKSALLEKYIEKNCAGSSALFAPTFGIIAAKKLLGIINADEKNERKPVEFSDEEREALSIDCNYFVFSASKLF